MDECRLLRSLSDCADIIYGHYASPVPLIVADRDFVYLECRRQEGARTCCLLSAPDNG